VAIQPDHSKIIVVGVSRRDIDNSDFAVVRYNTNGSLDTDFNGTGIVTTSISSGSDRGYGVAIQPDGKILVAGPTYPLTNSAFALARYTITGSLDSTFNGTGVVTTPVGKGAHAGPIAIQPDGKIVIAGVVDSIGHNSDFAVARYTITGSLDTNFNGTGVVTTPIGSSDDYAHSVALQPNGKIVVAGFRYNVPVVDDTFAVVRYNSDGSLDPTFNGTGIITTAINDRALGFSVAIQPDGNIVVAGASGTGGDFDFAVARYLGDAPNSGADTSVYLPVILKDS
jgi:uncharacterized delta-60 repeat protein